MRRTRKWGAILAVALLIGAAWHYGIITSAALTLKLAAIAIWNMLGHVAARIIEFLRSALSKLNH